MNHRAALLVAVVGLAILGAAVVGFGYLCASRARAEAARDELLECRELAIRIHALSRRPSLATEHERLAAETTGLVERAAGAAGIAPRGLARITPEPPQRVEDTVYKEKPVRVVLKRATLKQIVTFLHQLAAAADQGLQARSLRLDVSQAGAAGGAGDAEVVVAYLIYDPPRSLE